MKILSLYLVFSMLAVIWLDTTRYTIPNWLVGSLLLLYPLGVYFSPHTVDWSMALAGAGMVFVVGYIVFAMRWMGGGDIKLMAACALWVGFAGLLDFVFLFAVLGGVFSLLLYTGRKGLVYLPWPKQKSTLPRLFRVGEPVPYGVAIALAFLIILAMGKMPMVALQ